MFDICVLTFCCVFVYELMVQISLREELTYKKSFELSSDVTEFDRPYVTLCGWQDVKIQLVTSVTNDDCNYYSVDGVS